MRRKELKVPLDLASVQFDATEHSASEEVVQFPGQAQSSSLSFLSRVIVEALKGAITGDRATIALEVKFGEIVLDLLRLSYWALEVGRARENSHSIAFNETVSPVLAWLVSDNTSGEDAVYRHWPERKQLTPLKRSIYNKGLAGLRVARMTVLKSHGRIDFCHENTLLAEARESISGSWINIHPRQFSWPGLNNPAFAQVKKSVACEEVVIAWLDALQSLQHLEKMLIEKLRSGAISSIRYHLAMAFADIPFVESLSGRFLGEHFYSGTPKYYGRLLSWRYQQLGRQVTRFAHGGERVFFDDILWPLTELAYCDTYVCHSATESNVLSKRLKKSSLATDQTKKIKFVSSGSEKHKEIFRKASEKKGAGQKQSSQSVLYVPSVYFGESFVGQAFFRVNDVHYFKWQQNLFRTLDALGIPARIKVHPRGLKNLDTAIERLSEKLVSGTFNPNDFDEDIFLFDHAGTAFFDALASGKAIVYLNMGVRPLDPKVRPYLEERCAIVDCSSDSENVFCISVQSVKEAFKKALEIRGCPESFFFRFFA